LEKSLHVGDREAAKYVSFARRTLKTVAAQRVTRRTHRLAFFKLYARSSDWIHFSTSRHKVTDCAMIAGTTNFDRKNQQVDFIVVQAVSKPEAAAGRAAIRDPGLSGRR
jgi:hypothetical protein